MQPVERKPSLPAMTMSRLKAGITAGEWTERLPAERHLADQLQVSRPTLRIALLQLKQEGWLRGQGRRWWITRNEAQGRPSDHIAMKTVAFLSPRALPTLTSVGLYLFADLNARLVPLGATISCVQAPEPNSRQWEHRLTGLYDEAQADAWLLFRASTATQQFFARQARPALLIGNPSPGIDLPAVEIDLGAVSHHAAMALLRHNHHPKDLRLVIPGSDLGGHQLITDGFARALAPHLTQDQIGRQIFRHHEDHSDLLGGLANLLNVNPRPTGLIVLRTSAALEILGHLTYHLQYRLPNDLSLLSLEDTPFMASSVPEITRYHFDYRKYSTKVFDQLIKALSGIMIKNEQMPITPEMIPAQTLGKTL